MGDRRAVPSLGNQGMLVEAKSMFRLGLMHLVRVLLLYGLGKECYDVSLVKEDLLET